MNTSSFFKIVTLGLISSIALIVSPDAGAQADCPSCRTVTCRDQFGVLAASESLCTQTKPATGDTVQAGTRPWCPATVNHGICGSLSGATTPNTIATGSQLCTNGAAVLALFDPSINGTGSRSRTCAGANGGDTVSCSTIGQVATTGQVCKPKLFPVKKVDREGNLLEWQDGEVYIRGISGNQSNVTIPIGGGAGLADRLNRIIGAQIAYRNYNTSNGYNPNAYGECVGNYIGGGGSPLPEDIYAACGHLDTSTSTNAPNYYIRDHERNFSNGNYTLYTIYGTGRYEITADSTLLYSYVAVPGETATGPAREVTSIRLVGEYNAQVITDLNDPYSERAPIVYNDQTSAPWLGNYPSGDPQCTTRATESTCTQSERCSRVPDGAVCGTSSQPRYSVPGDINTVNTNGLCSVGIVGNDDAQSYLLYNNEYRAWECIDPNGGATAYCCANGTTAGECESYGY